MGRGVGLGLAVLAAWAGGGDGWMEAVEGDFIRAGFYLTVQTKPIFVDFLNSLRLSALRVARIRMSVLLWGAFDHLGSGRHKGSYSASDYEYPLQLAVFPGN